MWLKPQSMPARPSSLYYFSTFSDLLLLNIRLYLKFHNHKVGLDRSPNTYFSVLVWNFLWKYIQKLNHWVREHLQFHSILQITFQNIGNIELLPAVSAKPSHCKMLSKASYSGLWFWITPRAEMLFYIYTGYLCSQISISQSLTDHGCLLILFTSFTLTLIL